MKIKLSGYGPASTLIDTEHDVTITDAFRGPIFRTHDGACLAVFMRDDGYEANFWQGDADHDGALPRGAIMFAVDHRGLRRLNEDQPERTTVQDPLTSDADLLTEMGTDAAKWTDAFVARNPDADWGTMVSWFANAIEAGRSAGNRAVLATISEVDPLQSSVQPTELDMAGFFAGRTIGYSDLGWTWRGSGYDEGWETPTEEELVMLRRLLNGETEPAPEEADPNHHDPMWAVPDEPWTPDLTKCYECGGFGTIRSDVEGVNMSVVCNDCQGTGLADSPGDQMVAAVFQAIGGGSMCWEHVDRGGVFHSERAKWIGDGLVEWLRANGWHHDASD